ncbi:MAG: NYN domain-containing protein [Oscillospiraceae bacterium]|nr:NYN domain-containing protein [Oscillospiraceae bacterium]
MGEQPKKPHISAGLVAHVDAGKTTLSEALLYHSGARRTLGRVDHGDAFLDTHAIERSRGITIFSKQARLQTSRLDVTLVDTPGHVDFAAEAERTMPILDCAVLVISGTEAIQAHTVTLWRLLERYQIPTFLFINKMDLPGTDREVLLRQLQKQLSPNCQDFTLPQEQIQENAAMCDEALMEVYLASGQVSVGNIRALVASRRLFPCCFGSALKLTGVDGLLQILDTYAPEAHWPQDFGAQVYKIARDPQGARLTFLKVTGGSLRPRTLLGEEKIQQIRLYSGDKYVLTEEAPTGSLCAVTGLEKSYIGQGFGAQPPGEPPALQSVMTYRISSTADPTTLLPKLRLLEEEDPQLKLLWDDSLKQIHAQIMGKVQLEVLRSLVSQRFGVDIQFSDPKIFYKETIEDTVEGVGHFEPLRHYAEAHILLEPLPPGSGLVFDTICPTDVLDASYQSLILSHMSEKVHKGVLIGAPVTDIKMTLLIGKAHLKHTEGGDFRQATYRAIRQGLMQAKSRILEPWYDFTLTVPTEQVGRAITDIRSMSGRFDAPTGDGTFSTLSGAVPASELGDYADTLAAYTQGRGRLQIGLRGHEPCHDQEKVIADMGYDPEADVEDTPDSVFCAHGAGFNVKWNEVKDHMHLESALKTERPQLIGRNLELEEKQIEAILRRQFGPMTTTLYRPPQNRPAQEQLTIRPPRQQYLIVDGYNMIFAWDSLRSMAEGDLDAARRILCDRLSSYAGYKKMDLTVVFDGYKQKGSPGSHTAYHNIRVVYTKEGQTADAYIESLLAQIGANYAVRVATSDALIQLTGIRAGVLRLSARELESEVEQAHHQMRQYFTK